MTQFSDFTELWVLALRIVGSCTFEGIGGSHMIGLALNI